MKNFDAYRGDGRPFGVFIDPCEITEKGTEYIPTCDDCYFSFDTIEEARECARSLASQTLPTVYLYKVGHRIEHRTSKPDNPTYVVGYRIDGWTVSSTTDDDIETETFCRFDTLDDMLAECFEYELLIRAEDEIESYMDEIENDDDPFVKEGRVAAIGNMTYEQKWHTSKKHGKITAQLIEGRFNIDVREWCYAKKEIGNI